MPIGVRDTGFNLLQLSAIADDNLLPFLSMSARTDRDMWACLYPLAYK